MKNKISILPFPRRSRDQMNAIINQWLQLGKLSWQTRMEGFSMLLETEFGAFSQVGQSETDHWVEDRSVGLRLRTNAVQFCRLTGVPDNGDIQFRLNMQSHTDIFVSKSAREKHFCPILSCIEKTFGLDGPTSASPWLDEWNLIPDACKRCPVACYKTAYQICQWREVAIDVKTSDVLIHTHLKPTWADRDGTILRMFDSHRQMAIYVNLAIPTLSTSCLNKNIGTLHLNSQ